MTRKLLVVAGAALLLFGAARLILEVSIVPLFALVLWMAGAVAIHDGVIAPATIGVGWALRAVPPRARRFVQAFLIVSALVAVIALPLVARQGTQPRVKAILLRDYGTNLALLVGLVAAVSLMLYAASVVRSPARVQQGLDDDGQEDLQHEQPSPHPPRHEGKTGEQPGDER